jgi:hypothetical protein
MSTRITDTEITSDQTRHAATAWPVPDEPTLWSVTWLPGRALTRNQAITAVTLAEVVRARADELADPKARLWLHIEGWSAELGVTAAFAVAEASLSPEDQADMPHVRTLASGSEPGRTGYLLGLDRATGMARVRIDGETVTMPAAHLQYAGSPDPEPSRPTAAEHDASSTAAGDASRVDEVDSSALSCVGARDRSPR